MSEQLFSEINRVPRANPISLQDMIDAEVLAARTSASLVRDERDYSRRIPRVNFSERDVVSRRGAIRFQNSSGASFGNQSFQNSSSSSSNLNNIDLRVDETKEEQKIILCDRYKDLETIKEKGLECPICLNVISGTVSITTCLHKFCSKCLFQHCMTSANPSCPMCRSELTQENIILCDELTHFLDNCIIKCKNLECTVEVCRKEYYNHISSCVYNKKQCKDCKTLVYERDMNNHNSECEFRQIKCNLCYSFIHFRNQEDHINNHCPYNTVKCPNEQCDYSTQRCNLNSHISRCNHRKIRCYNGCQAFIECQDMKQHNEICPNRKIPCEYCTISFTRSSMDLHHTCCPKKLVECIYCHENILNGNMSIHHRSCSNKPVKCPNNCDMEIERRFILSHTDMCVNRSVCCNDCKQYYVLSRKELHDNSCMDKTIECTECNDTFLRRHAFEHSSVCLYKTINCKYSYAGCTGKFLRINEKEHCETCKDYHLDILELCILKNITINKKDDEKKDDEHETIKILKRLGARMI